MKKIILLIFATCLTLSAFTQVTPSGGLTGTGTPSLVPKWISSKKLGSSTTTTVQLSYLDATSSVQTQLNSKASNTKEFLLNTCYLTSTSPVDGSTLYVNELVTTGSNSEAARRFALPSNYTITKVLLTVFQGATGVSSENVSFYLRENNTTDNTITTTLDLSTATQNACVTYTYSGLNIATSSSSNYSFKFVFPTWTTNPTSVNFVIKVYGY